MADETEVTEKKPAKKKPAAAAKKKPAAKKPAAKKPAPKKKPAKKDSEQLKFAVEPEIVEAPPVDPTDDDDIEDAEVIAETPASELAESALAVELSPEEQELQALYGDDLAKPGIVHGEYQDRQTKDEDRPMMPEINARDERKQQWQERRDRRRGRREERERHRDERREQRGRQQGPQAPQAQQGAQGGQAQHNQQQRPPQQNQPQQAYRPVQPPVQINGTDAEGAGRVGTPLGDAAATVFAQLRNGQPLPVRQLAAMMRKRNLIETLSHMRSKEATDFLLELLNK